MEREVHMKSALRYIPVVVISIVMGSSSACRNRNGGNGNGNGNGGELTVEQEAAVNAVVEQLEVTAKAFGSVAQSFSGLDANGDGTFGECPVVTAEIANGVSNVEVDFGPAPGCENDYYDNPASGSVSLTLDTVARDLEIVFNALSVDEVTTNGSATMSLTRAGQSRTVTGTLDIATSGVGTAEGDLSVNINLAALTIAVDDADLIITDGEGTSYSVDITGIFIDPVGNGSFIPEAGTIRVEIPDDDGTGTITMVIEFNADSPATRVVQVTVANTETIDYELPG